MLLAQTVTGKSVDARTCSQGKSKEPYICPGCHEPVILRRGRIIRPHFAHKRQSQCQIFSEGETAEHLAGKELLLRFFPQAKMEVYLPQLAQRPDVLWQKFAFEFQCSPLRYDRFLERTSMYLTHSFQPVWLVGQRFTPQGFFTSFQKGCCGYHEKLGSYLYELDTERNRLIRYQHISWCFERGYTYEVYTRLIGASWCFVKKYGSRTSRTMNYRSWLQQQLMRGNPQFLGLQHVIYESGYSLFQLPKWCYEPSLAGFYFTHEVLVFRVYFLICSNQNEWISRVKNQLEAWNYPLISEDGFLQKLFLECQKLSQSSY